MIPNKNANIDIFFFLYWSEVCSNSDREMWIMIPAVTLKIIAKEKLVI